MPGLFVPFAADGTKKWKAHNNKNGRQWAAMKAHWYLAAVRLPVASWELEQRLSHPEWDKKWRERSVDRTWTGARVPWGRAPGGGWGSSRRRLARRVCCYYTRLQWWHRPSQLRRFVRAPRVCFLWQQFRSAPLAFSCVFVSQLELPSVTPLAPKQMRERGNLQTMLFFQHIRATSLNCWLGILSKTTKFAILLNEENK